MPAKTEQDKAHGGGFINSLLQVGFRGREPPKAGAEAPDRAGWKPYSLRGSVLGSLAALSVLIALGLEMVARRSQAMGALAGAPSADEVSALAVFASRYVPSGVAMLVGSLWSWVDVDVKRMQPWFELSGEGGARGRDSLFLDYPDQFLPLVPYRSARRRHWPVFWSSVAGLLVLWAIIPLQSTIFSVTTLSHQQSVAILQRSRLERRPDQARRIDARIFHLWYGIRRLEQPYPPFTTADYSLLPFYVDADASASRPQAAWTAATTKLWAEVRCSAADASRAQGDDTEHQYLVWIDSCRFNVSLGFQDWSKKSLQYLSLEEAYTSSVTALTGMSGCPAASRSRYARRFLAVWMERKAPDFTMPDLDKMTALVCEYGYYRQEVVATVGAGAATPHDASIRPLAERQPLAESEFDATAFERLARTGQGEPVTANLDPLRDDVVSTAFLEATQEHRSDLAALDLASTGWQHSPREDYRNASTLEAAIARGVKSVFALTVSSILVNDTVFSNRTAQSTYPIAGITVDRVFSAVNEILLLATAALSMALYRSCRRARCCLRSNPSSISRLADVFRDSPDVLKAFRASDGTDIKTLASRHRDDLFRLVPRGEGGLRVTRDATGVGREAVERKPAESEPHYDPVRPFALSRNVGVVFLAVVAATIGVLSWLRSRELAGNGLPLPAGGVQARRIVEKYLPSAYAGLIEPFWVLLNRHLCTIQPYQELRKGRALPARSIHTTYSAFPPQLTVWRAAKARHFLLALVGLTTLIGSILGIAMAALFNEQKVTVEYPSAFTPSIVPRFAQDYDEDRLFARSGQELVAAELNFSRRAQLPPWVSPAYFFLRHQVEAAGAEDTYTLRTRGLGADLDCTTGVARSELAGDAGDARLAVKPDHYPYCHEAVADPLGTLSLDVRRRLLECNDRCLRRNGTMTLAFDFYQTVSDPALRPDTPGSRCDNSFYLSWGRIFPAPRNGSTFDMSLALCKPVFETALFDVTVDARGHVLSYQRKGELGPFLGSEKTDRRAIWQLLRAKNYFSDYFFLDPEPTPPHFWLTYLQVLLSGSRAFLDPGNPIPDPVERVAVVRDVYRRLFAIKLGVHSISIFEKPSERNGTAVPVIGSRSTQETRVFMDQAAFILTITILSAHLLIAVVIYHHV
ncbi:hypothetical protein CDD83_1359 [Cordyceps sp. RAO-2017]|nr:hypothetical protein CDD83_1359 [Cordyceps sp. RAO-2017]